MTAHKVHRGFKVLKVYRGRQEQVDRMDCKASKVHLEFKDQPGVTALMVRQVPLGPMEKPSAMAMALHLLA